MVQTALVRVVVVAVRARLAVHLVVPQAALAALGPRPLFLVPQLHMQVVAVVAAPPALAALLALAAAALVELIMAAVLAQQQRGAAAAAAAATQIAGVIRQAAAMAAPELSSSVMNSNRVRHGLFCSN
jgi:hypothetical protein